MGSDSTIYVYDAYGELAAEYSTVAPNLSGPLYLTSDHLGSTRVATTGSGGSQECFDYLPFGEELANGSFNRGSCFPGAVYPINPSADPLDRKFTGKERDAETGLDYFGARYFSSAQGRFASADPITVTPGRVVDPQQLNLYAYARNNPLRYVDPTGMIIDISQLSDDDKKKWQQVVNFANQKDENGNYVNPTLHEAYDTLDKDSRTFVIADEKLDSGTAGEFTITKLNGPNDFSEAKVALDFSKIKAMEKKNPRRLRSVILQI